MFAKVSSIILLGALLSTAAWSQDSSDSNVATRLDCEYGEERLRRRPGHPAPDQSRCDGDGVQPAVWRSMPDFVAMPDRWRIVSALGYPERWWDPYNQNVIKGDYPIIGQNTFFNLTIFSLSVIEGRQVPTATTPFESTLRRRQSGEIAV